MPGIKNNKILSGFIVTMILFTQAIAQVNDATTPLHAMKPDYPVPYDVAGTEQIKMVLDRVFHYVDAVTPAAMVNKKTGMELTSLSQLDTFSIINPGDFRLTSYEWGVTYAAMLHVYESTGDERYRQYVKNRFDFLAKWIPAVRKTFSLEYINSKKLLNQPIDPHALDDGGAVCAAMIKATRAGISQNLREQIDHYIDYVFKKEYRLPDGTIARNRPQKNTLWLDDLFMYIPAVAQMGKLTGDKKYFDDAVKQVIKYSDRMFVKQKGLYMHGWVESMSEHPAFHWGRANGWAVLAMTELLDVLPPTHPGYQKVLQQLRTHIQGLVGYQSGSGFWHQLLDRNDSYLETSATAIYSYCIAHACNKRWINPMTYAPAAILAWNAVSTKVTDRGQVEGTCVGTGMAFDPLFYYHRPVNNYAAHGYGPVLMAGAEIIDLIKLHHFRIDDSSLQLE